jgi:vitamin B12 transporter
MSTLHHRLRSVTLAVSICLVPIATQTVAQTPHGESRGSVHGIVRDPLGAAVTNATVDLLDANNTIIVTTRTDADGTFQLPIATGARYALRSSANTFAITITPPRFLPASGSTIFDVTLSTPTSTEEITVTATGTPTPLAQVSASVAVLTSDQFPHSNDIQEPLRYVPGLQLTQTGQAGGTGSLSIRGGNTNTSKVLIDGVPANDIGGAAEFANIATTGIAHIEVLREPNSALYGSDALAGVVSLITKRGTTSLPQLVYSAEGGNFSSYRQEAALSGVIKKLDYFTGFGRQDTHNSIPNNSFHNATFAANFGFQPDAKTDLRLTYRHLATSGGKPNAFLLYAIADAAGSKEQDQIISGTLNHQATERWHNLLRYGGLRLNYEYSDYAPTGIPFVVNGTLKYYLGAPVTIKGANGYSVTGQAIFQRPTTTFPNFTVNSTKRDFTYAQSDYRINTHVTALSAFKYESERGSSSSTGSTTGFADRGNYSYVMQLQGDLRNRAYYTIGSGLEKNAVYGFAATPRASLGYYLVRPGSDRFLSGTKLHASFAKGIKGPSIFQQNNSLQTLLAASPTTSSLIARYNIGPVGPETSRTYDGGLDQELAYGRARIGLTYFHNEFGNTLEFLSQTALISFGVPAAALPNVSGAYVNSLSYRTQGLETEIELKLGQHFFARGGYTLLEGKVQQSFSSSALKPVFNTAYNFGTIPIGGSGPLKNNRPFRRARNTGYFGLNYTRSRFSTSLNGTLVGLRDDSDFLTSDPNGKPFLLLPNQNLLGRYQRLEVTGDYRITHHLTAYTEIQNLLSEHYSEAFGYPALPLNFRAGFRIALGGESWKLK